MTNHDVEHAIKKRMSGDVRDAFVAIGQCSLWTGPLQLSLPRHCLLLLGHGDSQWGRGLVGHLEPLARARLCTKERLWLRQQCHSSWL